MTHLVNLTIHCLFYDSVTCTKHELHAEIGNYFNVVNIFIIIDNADAAIRSCGTVDKTSNH